jgi:nucleoid-associated protein YgaU
MSQKITFLLLISLFFTVSVFAQYDLPELELKIPEFISAPYYAATIPEDENSFIPQRIRNNEFFLESLRLNKLALDNFEYGDYDASVGYAEEAIRFAQLSDEYVAVQLIDEAKRLLDFADRNNIARLFPHDYNEGRYHYEAAVTAHLNDEWDEAINAATKSIGILAALELESGSSSLLPSQYIVRTWAVERDCLWNIAAYPWVYGDPMRWVDLYEANRSRMPDPSNPDLIEPGFVLEIPSIRGEVRRGVWNPSRP